MGSGSEKSHPEGRMILRAHYHPAFAFTGDTMSTQPPEENLLKRFHLSFEFDFDIEELTEMIAKEYLKIFTNGDDLVRDFQWGEHLERQKRLLHALLNNPAVLKLYIIKSIHDLFEAEATDMLEEHLSDYAEVAKKNDEDILSMLLPDLESKDQELINWAIENRLLYENTAEFCECFKLHLRYFQLTESKASKLTNTA
jgi:hypothetical protein